VLEIKTIGDAYMVVGGLDAAQQNPAAAIADMALAMRCEVEGRRIDGSRKLRMRFGVASGPVVAGVIGSRKLSYDLWGETVNAASRMGSHGEPDRIQVDEATYRALRQSYTFSASREVQIKGKGPMNVHFLAEPLPRVAHDPNQTALPNR